MRLARIVRLRLRSLFRPSRADRDLDDELRFHLDKQIERHVATGMSEEHARRAALREFGSVTLEKEKCRDARGVGMIANFFEDVRYALRGLRRDPLLAVAATATLAIAIGANTTVFSIVDSILIRPLPYPNADRIYWVSEHLGSGQDLSIAPDYYSLRDENRVFEDVAAYDTMSVTWSGSGEPQQLDIAQVAPSFFRVMGMRPLLGRYLNAEEIGPKAPPVVVLSYVFWRTRLGADPNIVGKTIRIDRLPATVIGVMPQGFDYPQGMQLWRPLPIDEADQRVRLNDRPTRLEYIVARRKPQVERQAVSAEMNRLGILIHNEYPKDWGLGSIFKTFKMTAEPLQRLLTGDLRPALLVLSGGVGLVLLIACVNLANLLLARASVRARELAVRMALGSSRARIVRQLLTESLVLALPGGLLGIAIAAVSVYVLNATKPYVLVRYSAISIDVTVLAFTLALTILTRLTFGIAPALSGAGVSIQETLKAAGLAHSGARGSSRLRRALVVAELSVSLVLLIGAGLLSRSFLNLAHTSLGFPPDHLLTMRIRPAGGVYRSPARQNQFFDELTQRIRRLPIVRDVALSTNIPLSNTFMGFAEFQVAGRPPLPAAQWPRANQTFVSPEFFRTLGVPLKSGRVFGSQDRPDSAAVVVVNEALARKVFPREQAVGHSLALGPVNRWKIIGVVGDVRGAALGVDPPLMIYRCICQNGDGPILGLVVRTGGDPKATIHDVESAVHSLDRDQPVFDVKTMQERMDAALSPERFQLILIGTFAAIALLLAAAGVYGVMSYLVARRTREIGIRMALGASPSGVLRMVIAETAVLVLLAVVAGLGGAWALTRYAASLLYGVTALDGLTFTLTPALLAAIVLLASLGPARRAAHVDPMTALRQE